MKHLSFPWRILLTLGVSIFNIVNVQATHLRAGEITVERVNCESRTVRITIRVYTNSGSPVLFGGEEELYFGDGNSIPVPQTENTRRPDLDPQGIVSTASFTVLYTYPGNGTYVITYREPMRNENILNIDRPGENRFYLETVIKIDPFLGCNNTPILEVPPIDHACPGVAWTHNPGASDPEGDKLTYEMVVPFRDRDTEVTGYTLPIDRKFYTDFEHGDEAGTARPKFAIDSLTGIVTWDAPGAVGEYNIAFHIIEWRLKNGVWYQLGYVRRDMQIIVDDCENKRPDLILPNDTCVVAGTALDETIFGIDPENHDVKIVAFSEIFKLPPNQSPATYAPIPGVNDFQKSKPPAQLKFHWQTDCGHVREQPYRVIFQITDKPPRGPRLVTYKAWTIKVIGPPPEWNDIALSGTQRSALLKWDPYACEDAEHIQIWRKIDGAPFIPDNCQTGLPQYLGYELIDKIAVTENTFTDNNSGKGLSPGARYCYRLVAVFPQPRGGESYVSKDTCIGPVPALVPVITHVSVEKTAPASGQIRASWRKPFDVDQTLFPPPYNYELYRADGFARGADSVLVAANISDTTFVDIDVNTQDNVYNYSVTAYASTGIRVGSSVPASSVRLAATSSIGKIQLSWRAFVPWSNQIQSFPNRHLIYKGPEGATEQQLVLIDSVDVTSNGFSFADVGQHGALEESETYCYRIMTRGGYGNPEIEEPLKNFSQIICTTPGDTIPPCKPRLVVNARSCEEYLAEASTCGTNIFKNTISWTSIKDDACDTQIIGYRVFRADKADGMFTLLSKEELVTDTFFVDDNIPSLAYCYKVSAVDRSLNESEWSDAVCNDNCPYYELPNVFTPNNDGCNDLFSAYSDREPGGEEAPGCELSPDAKGKCARFVKAVNFKVYNRWGQEVYAYYSSNNADNSSIYIDWDGKSSHGSQLSSGVYYYIAEVTFDVLLADNTKTIKGWVHLVR